MAQFTVTFAVNGTISVKVEADTDTEAEQIGLSAVMAYAEDVSFGLEHNLLSVERNGR